MSHHIQHHHHRKPTATEAYVCIALVGILIVATLLVGAPIQFGILLATAASFLMALRLGFSWEEMELAICERLGRMGSTMLIMWLFGMLLGAMLFSGLIPMLVYYGFQLIDPRFLYLGAFLSCTIMSTMTGSSWSAAGTAGVVCIALAQGHHADLGIMAGAIIAGSVFGDKISPMSETTNLAPACAGTDLWSHIRSQLWTTIPAWILAAILFTMLGMEFAPASNALPETAQIIMEQLDALFVWNPVLLLPVAVLLILALLKKPVIPTMLLCSLLSLALGCLVQGFDVSLGCNAAITGFTADSIVPAGFQLDETVAYILNRGGMTSMVSIILVCFCGFSMTTVLTHGGILEKAIEPLARNLNTRWKTMLTAEIATLVTLSMGGISYVSSVFVGEAWQKPFIQNGMGRPCLSRTLEDVGTCAAAVVPWCSSAMFYVETLGVPVWGPGGFAPYTVLPFVCPIAAFLLAWFGIGISKLTPEEIAEELKDITEEEEEAFLE